LASSCYWIFRRWESNWVRTQILKRRKQKKKPDWRGLQVHKHQLGLAGYRQERFRNKAIQRPRRCRNSCADGQGPLDKDQGTKYHPQQKKTNHFERRARELIASGEFPTLKAVVWNLRIENQLRDSKHMPAGRQPGFPPPDASCMFWFLEGRHVNLLTSKNSN